MRGAVPVLMAMTAAFVAMPATAAAPVIAGVETSGGTIVAHVLFADPPGASPIDVPARLDATVHAGGQDRMVTLVRTGEGARIPPGGWATIDYSVSRPDGVGDQAILSLADAPGGYAFAAGPAPAPAVAVARQEVPAPSPPAATPTGDGARPGNLFLHNLSTYQPIYALLGHGTDTDARIQISFKYQLLGQPGDGHWWNGFHFAYTQKMFWDLGASSAPFRDVNYQPELIYIYRHPEGSNGLQWGAQGGFLHQSNGRDGAASRAYNIVYAEPQATWQTGGWTLTAGPRVWAYVIGRDGNEDIARYRGHQSLAFSALAPNGLKLSALGRYGFGSGKGAIDADLSYPLGTPTKGIPLYIILQGFSGYGEDLLDYNRKQTRLRVGIGLVR